MSDLLPRPEPREPFKRALRSQLMTHASTALARRETAWSRFQRGLLRPAVAFAAVALLLVGSAGKAAADSLSGDPAFGLKTAGEQLQLALAFDDTTRLALLSEHAEHRLVEVSRAITTRPSAARTATDEYAIAVARFTAAVDAIRGKPGASVDKRTAAEDVVDAAHLKHEAVLNDLEKSEAAEVRDGRRDDARDDVRDELERAKLEAGKLHASDRPARTPEPAQRADPTRSPQPTRTAAPARTPEPTRTAPRP